MRGDFTDHFLHIGHIQLTYILLELWRISGQVLGSGLSISSSHLGLGGQSGWVLLEAVTEAKENKLNSTIDVKAHFGFHVAP